MLATEQVDAQVLIISSQLWLRAPSVCTTPEGTCACRDHMLLHMLSQRHIRTLIKLLSA